MTDQHDLAHLSGLVHRLRRARVLCVGDLMLDRFIYGSVERISPEAPIPVLKIEHEISMLGGAGNVLRNLAALGSGVRFVAAVGDDGVGVKVRQLLDEQETVEKVLAMEPGKQTTIKTRFIAGTQQMLRADRESSAAFSAQTLNKIRTAGLDAIRECGAVVLSDYGKGVLTTDVVEDLVRASASAGRPVIVDPKGVDYSRYRGAALVTPNRRELAQAAGMPTNTDGEIIAAAKSLMDGCGIGAVLCTRGRDGMTLVGGDGAITHFKAMAREVYDVSGAGDTVVATVAAALASGAGLTQAAALANVAAGIVVGKVGTAAAYAADLLRALRHRDLSTAEAKVLALEPALDLIHLWRRKGRKIAFTNGCFDIVHPGHISLLTQARNTADRLVVGLNSDSSVTRLKGEGRPVQSEAARAAVLSSLELVDMVVIFDEDTPLDLIAAVRPDVLIKGADYKLETVVGADVVQEYGGKVVLAELEPGHSTSATIERIGK